MSFLARDSVTSTVKGESPSRGGAELAGPCLHQASSQRPCSVCNLSIRAWTKLQSAIGKGIPVPPTPGAQWVRGAHKETCWPYPFLQSISEPLQDWNLEALIECRVSYTSVTTTLLGLLSQAHTISSNCTPTITPAPYPSSYPIP